MKIGFTQIITGGMSLDDCLALCKDAGYEFGGDRNAQIDSAERMRKLSQCDHLIFQLKGAHIYEKK